MREREFSTLSIEQIVVSQGRELDSKAVASIADSIDLVGLHNPILVFADDKGEFRVISGRHRLAAMRSLGWDRIDAFVYRGLSEIEIRLAEIIENLHRAELTALDRSEQVKEYVDLAKQRREQGAAQLGQRLSNEKGASGREGGDSAAARDLGITRQKIQRSEKISKITPGAKAAAKAAGLDRNESALLKVSSAPEDQQEKVVADLAVKKEKKRSVARPRDDSEQRLDKDTKGREPAKDAIETVSGNDPSQRRPFKDVQETVKAILRDFPKAEVESIIDALIKAIGLCSDLDDFLAEVTNSPDSECGGDHEATEPIEVIESFENFELNYDTNEEMALPGD